jgi:hypothetical protein
MSFTRSFYDTGAAQVRLNDSVAIGSRVMSHPEPCEGCYPVSPDIRLQHTGVSMLGTQSWVDLEGDLMNLNRKGNRRDPNSLYKPQCGPYSCDTGEPCGQGVVGQCSGMAPGQRVGDNRLIPQKDCMFGPEPTRATNPPCNNRAMAVNRWEWLCHDPQKNLEPPFEMGVSTRIIVKDNHRPFIPTPIDQRSVWPNSTSVPDSILHQVFTLPTISQVPASYIERY